jgi:hypothetical protein
MLELTFACLGDIGPSEANIELGTHSQDNILKEGKSWELPTHF